MSVNPKALLYQSDIYMAEGIWLWQNQRVRLSRTQQKSFVRQVRAHRSPQRETPATSPMLRCDNAAYCAIETFLTLSLRVVPSSGAHSAVVLCQARLGPKPAARARLGAAAAEEEASRCLGPQAGASRGLRAVEPRPCPHSQRQDIHD